MNNYTTSTGSSTGSNSGMQKHLVPSGSFLKSGTKSATPTSAQTGQTYAQPTQTYTQTETAATVEQTYSQTGTEYNQPYTQSNQTYAQTTGVDTALTQFGDSPNMILGIIGMIVGLALSTGLIILFYDLERFGKIQILAACFTYLFAMKGYMLLGQGIDLKGTVLCSVVVLIMVYFSHELAIAYHLQKFWGETIDFATSYKSIKLFLDLNPDYKKWYYLELGVAYFINIACVVMGPRKVFEKRQ